MPRVELPAGTAARLLRELAEELERDEISIKEISVNNFGSNAGSVTVRWEASG